MLLAQSADPQFDLDFFFDFIFSPSRALLIGVAITVSTAVVAQVVGTILGTFSALAALSKSVVLRLISGFYVWFFRGVPTLVQIFLVYFGTPALFGTDLFPTQMEIFGVGLSGAVAAGTIALAINEGAYMSEIMRAGIMSVDPGQKEAALSVGMTNRLAMRRVILPQAARIIVPPLGNNFNNMLKMTSLLSVIGVQEMFRVAEGVNAVTFKTFESFFGVALYYLVLLTIWAWIQKRVENRLNPVDAPRTSRRARRRQEEINQLSEVRVG
jgi:polar amino acid transport system permease protein